jgi:two-component system CheB/CheR fusion protein
MKKQLTQTGKTTDRLPPVVAIGASAGGIEAISELLQHLPSNTGMVYIYIQHLNPDHDSKLSAILSRITEMNVQEAEKGMLIKADHIYIIPPDKEMNIEDGVLDLSTRKKSFHFPIDTFFTSLANNRKQGVIGILLSGSGSDGTQGLKAIKAAGGLTYAQDESAMFQSMPQSAIHEDSVDMILSPEEMANELKRLSNEFTMMQHAIAFDESNDEHYISNDHEDLVSIIKLLKRSAGIDFLHYKRNTIKRRIVRRMLLYKLDTLKDYLDYLKQHSHEINTLYNDLLINVTSFFRDPDTMEYLKKTILPRIIKSKGTSDPIRIWIPACSTGEEAYSIAILLMEILGTRAANTPVQIFATDLSENAINKARLGIYSKNDLLEVSTKRIQRFFTNVDGHYRIIKPIRDMCVFAPHNVFKDPPFSRLDFVSCCNLFIYLEPALQKKIMATFHYALNQNGILMLGKSEALGESVQLFTQIEKKFKIYVRKEASSKAIFDMNYRLPDYTNVKESITKKRVIIKETGKMDDIDKTIDDILLTRYTPPSVVVNHDLEILQFRGSTGLFLEPSPGKASFSLLKMARPGLTFDLRSIVHKANKTGTAIKKSGLEVKYKGAVHYVSIEAIPLKQENEERLFLITFEETIQPQLAETKESYSKDKLVKQLQDELLLLKEDLRSIVEDQEASNEELQSANEEIVSSNEELQSINEELETSKEEVESTNEELMTINQELQIRNDQLAESHEYAEAVFTTLREAILVLDINFRIKKANRAFYKMFHLKENETDGKLIFELANRQWDIPELRTLLKEVTHDNPYLLGFELKHNFPGLGEKTLLLNVRKVIQKSHQQELILLAIEDITEHKVAEKIINEREEWFLNMANHAPVMIWVSGTDKLCTFFNKTWLDYTGREMKQELGNGWAKGVFPDDVEQCVNVYNVNFDLRKPFQTEYRFRRFDGEYHWVMCNGKPTYSHDGIFTGYVGSVIDIHDQKLFSEKLEEMVVQRTKALRESNTNLEHSNSELRQFAYVASHDLQEPLRKIIIFSDRFQKKFGEKMGEEGAGYLDKISSSAMRMRQLIKDLLNFSKTSNPNEQFEKTDLNAIVNSVLKTLDLEITQKKVKFHIDTLPQVPAIPVQMTQLFHNLIGNALKFSIPGRHPQISIQSGMADEKEIANFPQLKKKQRYHHLIVKDNGIGFDPNFAEQIFVIFQRLNEREDYEGTGIGLALCKKIVNFHKGHIYAEAIEKEGATFHIFLPASEQE